ncbi:right-handed parallel beta-helix repeat-containing protein [Phocaeicola vulgatus]|uniref:Right-handed parallel beta-helix repeat-containing protein n=2 Tax=Bacteroidaceae TaxID=815 RepID=A0A413XWX6_PHOVU|nr:right-handed parallel beta-helix repeat-containing protein [Phocaeicola vulgatus]HAY24585.1 alpha-1,3-galactosidase B [Bacteroides sp.]KAB6451946.1 right-handed parallel beta-helix repeat-containing protein [Phocaeicola vulgatus]KAB6477273.1 right-handed parallel beta-helix repeat-containing protein [Phocaeicola vulgatus]MBV3464822.1 right-handed parallel beta-helix repeat-containing protein [Phocaeicola vulgatus]MBV3509506.1 right-handed parallel beta-helix repeat-containing protein [Phoca
MKMKLLSVLSLSLVLSCTTLSAQKVYEISAFGLKANSSKNASPVLQKALAKIKAEYKEGEKVILRFPEGRYEFHEKGAAVREYYISNHDQTNPKKVGIALEDMKNLTLDGQGSEFVFHGRMLPVSLLRSENCLLKNFSIDFENPHIAQVKIVENDPQDGIVFEPAPWVDYRIAKDSIFEAYGEGWTMRHSWGIAFDGDTKHLVYNTSDIGCPTKGASEVAPRRIHAPGWKDARLVPGTVVAMRGWGRPTPGIFLSHDVNTTIENVKVHYAEGMGLLAQLCENITLEKFGVCLKGDADPRYFTTQADATHFSGCKGKIVSCNGLYEGMMDDAINVHGTYLKVVKRVDDCTLVGRYMHGQSWGFEWGCPGDEVQFIRSNTMELVGKQNKIISIRPYDKEQTEGAREFLITFQEPVDQVINEQSGFGIENLTWTPEVLFSGNVIRNNRARGSLFSTPRKTIVENNLFDHTSGAAILLCGDCNGWFETGACRHVIIRKNRFVNALTNLFQFTNAVISIYPEIPDLKGQQQYFHGGPEGGIVIEDNEFETFDAPILYAKSVDGLVFRNNTIKLNTEYKPFHPNRNRFWLERVTNVTIAE